MVRLLLSAIACSTPIPKSPLASYSGVLKEAITPLFIGLGIGLEATYLGMNRWGMTREQYDHPNFRRHCREILNVSVDQIEAFSSSGYEFLGVLGVNGSPNCGVDKTCVGFSGGEIASVRMVAEQLKKNRYVKKAGVFMAVLMGMLEERNLSLRFIGVNEENPTCLVCDH
ncbi:DUF523 domain-containing protein [Desulfonema ishimotonii]|uniref:DUF523 domain-containing protein n=1 Tax=Desulfonema ishimotonii TaxID=45657 RepID=A0A401FUR2_9BACT|nr:hypothetical protein [Desulfonema ishimotonii]GBC60695.1 DUF523 domain-containing protein [Desulfonema ishimotonii]